MQIPHAIHRLFYDRNYPTILPTRWTCEPHIVTLRDRSGTVACPQGGWIVRAWYDGFPDPAIGYVMVDRYGTGVDYSPLPDPHPQPFEIGPERRHDSGWWRTLAISLAEWDAFIVSCSQQQQATQ